MSKATVIDEYFAGMNLFPHVPYVPLGEMIVEECRRMRAGGLWVSTAAALVEQESGGKNIFGCDAGGPFCHERVTPEKTRVLLEHVRAGGTSQGVGVTQITYGPLLLAAGEDIYRPRIQMRVGFSVLNNYLSRYEYLNALEAYNDGSPRFNDPHNPYELQFASKHAAWKARL